MVTVELKDGVLCITPSPDALKEELKYFKRSMGYNVEKRRREVTGKYEQLYTEQIDTNESGDQVSTLCTMPGFAHKVLKWLRDHHIEYTIKDCRTPMPEPDLVKAMEGLRDYQMEPAFRAIKSGGGIVCAPTGYGKSRLMAAIIKAYDPEALKLRGTPTVVVAVPDKDITRKNYEGFLELFPDRDVGLVMSGSRKFSDDIQVITLDSLHLINPDEVGILIVDEMHTAASDTRAESLMKFTKAAKWGVSATPTGRFDGKDIVSEGIFGPIVVNKGYQDGVKSGALVPIKVYWITVPEPEIGLLRYGKYKTRDGKLKAGLYANTRSNRLIADILNCMPEELQTLCMVQFIEHMSNIHRLCKDDVKFVHAETSNDKLLKYPTLRAISPKERKEIYTQVRDREIMKIISTHVYKQGVDFPQLDVVLCAGGGGSDIVSKQVPGRASRKTDGKDTAIVIDFWHPWDTQDPGNSTKGNGPILAADKQRRKAYAELGFEQVWLNNIKDLPFLNKDLVSETVSAKRPMNNLNYL